MNNQQAKDYFLDMIDGIDTKLCAVSPKYMRLAQACFLAIQALDDNTWINAKRYIPDEDRLVLVCLNNEKIMLGHIYVDIDDTKKWAYDSPQAIPEDYNEEVLYWREMPVFNLEAQND